MKKKIVSIIFVELFDIVRSFNVAAVLDELFHVIEEGKSMRS